MQTNPVNHPGPSTSASISKPFIVVCGCPRSGTYLLCSLMEAELDIAFPVETHFIPLFSRYIKLWEPLKKTRNRLRLLSAIRRFTQIWIYYGIRSRKTNQQKELSLLPILDDMCRNNLAPNGNDYADIVNELFSTYANKHGNSYYGDKSAFFEPVSLRAFDKSLPNMHVINIIRDGRDVALSWQKEWFGPRTLAEASMIWKQYIELHREWGKSNPSRYLEVRYEDLVMSPDDVLMQISDFLGITGACEDKNKARESKLARMLRDETTHPLIGTLPDPANAGKWRKDMNTTDITFFEYIAGSTLYSSGYPLVTHKITLTQKLIFPVRLVWGMICHYINLSYWKRRLRTILPLILRLIQ